MFYIPSTLLNNLSRCIKPHTGLTFCVRNVKVTGIGRDNNALFPRLLEYTLTVNRANLTAPGYYPIDDCKIPSTLCSFTLHLGAKLPCACWLNQRGLR